MSEFFARLLILLLIFGSLTLVILASRKVNKKVNLKRDLLPTWKPGRSSILFFTSDSCIDCNTLKKTTLASIQVKNIPVHEINALSAVELSQYFRVLSVPTTIILDHNGGIKYVNHGFVDEKTLSAQLTMADK